jgi:hypothetical protein
MISGLDNFLESRIIQSVVQHNEPKEVQMAKRTYAPRKSVDSIVQAIFESPEGALTAREIGVVPARLNGLVEAGVLACNPKATQKVTDSEGRVQRGRPRHVFRLSKNTRARVRRAAAKSAA